MGEMPARFFVQFFKNHGLLSVSDRPQWRVIQGGSRNYVERLTAPFRDRIRLNCPVEWVRRHPNQVQIKPKQGLVERFDQVVVRHPQRSGVAPAGRLDREGTGDSQRDSLSGKRGGAAHRYSIAAAPEISLGGLELSSADATAKPGRGHLQHEPSTRLGRARDFLRHPQPQRGD
jgi:hypothetical protein